MICLSTDVVDDNLQSVPLAFLTYLFVDVAKCLLTAN